MVDVRGCPLGAFKATNVGKVVSTYDHDDEKDWDHVDFVVDAQLSPGNSGSPVLAVSCRTGEFELVGVYHAGYAGNTPLNVVVAIDQVRDMMTTLKKGVRRDHGDVSSLDRKARTRLEAALPTLIDPFFPFDGAVALVRARGDGALIFEVMPPAFPVRSIPALVLEDLPATGPDAFGQLGRIWVGSRFGLKQIHPDGLDPDAVTLFERVLEGVRANAMLAFELRAASALAARDREHYEQMGKLERQLRRMSGSQTDLANAVADVVDRLGPKVADTAVALSEVYAVPPQASPGRNVARQGEPEGSTAASPAPSATSSKWQRLPSPWGPLPAWPLEWGPGGGRNLATTDPRTLPADPRLPERVGALERRTGEALLRAHSRKDRLLRGAVGAGRGSASTLRAEADQLRASSPPPPGAR